MTTKIIILILVISALLIGCSDLENELIDYQDNDCDSYPILEESEINCEDIVYNNGEGIEYPVNDLTQRLCIEKLIYDMNCKMHQKGD